MFVSLKFICRPFPRMNETLSLPFFGKLLTVKLPSIPTIQRVLYQLRLHYGYIKPSPHPIASPLPLVKTSTSVSSPPLPSRTALSHSQGAISSRPTHASSVHLTDEQSHSGKTANNNNSNDNDNDNEDKPVSRRSNSVSFFSSFSSSPQPVDLHLPQGNPLLSPVLPPRPASSTNSTNTHVNIRGNDGKGSVYGIWDENGPRVRVTRKNMLNQDSHCVREELETEEETSHWMEGITEEKRESIVRAASEWFSSRMDCGGEKGEQTRESHDHFSDFIDCCVMGESANRNSNTDRQSSYPIMDGPFTVCS